MLNVRCPKPLHLFKSRIAHLIDQLVALCFGTNLCVLQEKTVELKDQVVDLSGTAVVSFLHQYRSKRRYHANFDARAFVFPCTVCLLCQGALSVCYVRVHCVSSMPGRLWDFVRLGRDSGEEGSEKDARGSMHADTQKGWDAARVIHQRVNESAVMCSAGEDTRGQ